MSRLYNLEVKQGTSTRKIMVYANDSSDALDKALKVCGQEVEKGYKETMYIRDVDDQSVLLKADPPVDPRREELLKARKIRNPTK